MKRLVYYKSILFVLLCVSCGCTKPTDIPTFDDIVPVGKTAITKMVIENSNLIASVSSDVAYELTDGVTLTEVRYVAEDGAPTKVFLTEVDLSVKNVSVAVGLPKAPAITEKPTIQAEGVESETVSVWAGCNGDFFEPSTGAQGICYVNGVAIKAVPDAPLVYRPRNFFAILDNGKAMIGTQEEYEAMDKDQIYNAIGGGVMLVDDGRALIPTPANTAIHPRSGVGVSKDGSKVYIMVVDGRNYTYSNGMEYIEMSQFFAAIGAHRAYNIDGGGSSVLFTRSAEGEFVIRNCPTDNGGAERSVANSLLVVTKK